jgi:GT2 family glycosyltransferase
VGGNVIMVQQPKVCVVIVTWNRSDAVVRCVLSLNALQYENLDVVVVDNNSQDGTVDRLKAIFPSLKVLVNEKNQGYCGGNNRGIRYALEHGAQYVFLLNNDATVHPHVISHLVRTAESDPAIAVVGAKNLNARQPYVLWAAWGEINYGPTLTRIHGQRKLDGPKYRQIRDVDQVIGCGCMWRRESLLDVGLLDENFFGYHEDVDWCHRARVCGWRVVFVGPAIVFHEGSLSCDPQFGSCIPVMYFLGRNAVLFTKKHANFLQAAKLALSSVTGSLSRYRRNRRYGSPTGEKQFWQGFWDGIMGHNRQTEFGGT